MNRRDMALKTIALVLLLGPAAGASMPALAGLERNWDFRVLLDEREVGYHRVTVTPGAQGDRVRVEARFDVKVLFIPAFRYEHEASEVWTGERVGVAMKTAQALVFPRQEHT